MTCINCFFSPEYQRHLKCQTHNIERFENRLQKYKQLFINKLKKLKSIEECNCKYHNVLNLENSEYEKYVNYTNKYFKIILDNTSIIEEFFNLIIDTYILYISKSYKHAVEQFWEVLQKYKLNNSLSNSVFNEILFFRARLNDNSYDINNPKNFFHIPFNQRYKVGNQRFSISGQPMLYFGNSILTICKELEKTTDELAFSAFIPTYNVIKNINLLSPCIYELQVNNLPAIAYSSDMLEINPQNILNDVRKSLLCEILTFPTKNKGAFVEEYVLPQAYTTLLIENGWYGIKYPSTKDYSNVRGIHRFSKYNYNFAIFTNYHFYNNLDEELFNKFIPILPQNLHSSNITINEIEQYMKNIKEQNKKYNAPCISYFINQKIQIDDLKSATIDGKNYFDTEYGKIELNLMSELYNKILQIMKYQYYTSKK